MTMEIEIKHDNDDALHVGIMELLKSKAKAEFEYINPNFILGITELLESYYQLEDDDVDQWAQDMFGA